MYKRMCIIQRTAGTVALAGTVQTIGTDIETDSTWGIAITADDTANKGLNVMVTGAAGQSIAWICDIEALEIGYND